MVAFPLTPVPVVHPPSSVEHVGPALRPGGSQPGPGRAPGTAGTTTAAAAALARQVEPATVLAPDLARLLATVDTLPGGSEAPVDWPQPGDPRTPLASTPRLALALLRGALESSPLFAVPRLAERWFPAPVALPDHPPAGAGKDGVDTNPPGQATQTALAEPAPVDERPPAPPGPADRPTREQLAQAAALLIGGHLHWDGTLTPGVPARLVRQDHWHPDRDADGRPVHGTRFRLDVDLPHLGRLTIEASDGDHAHRISVTAPADAARRLRAEQPGLDAALKRAGGLPSEVEIRSAQEPSR